MTPLEVKTTARPSGDNRFKLLDRAITKHHGSGDALIEILHVAQGIFGFLENDLMVYIANALKLPLSRVYGVATFYHFFRLKPQGEHTFVLCTGTACYVKGANEIQKAVEHHCNCKFGETTKDNKTCVVDGQQRTRAIYGFNIGINVGTSAGQTISHVHIHLIPRYKGT